MGLLSLELLDEGKRLRFPVASATLGMIRLALMQNMTIPMTLHLVFIGFGNYFIFLIYLACLLFTKEKIHFPKNSTFAEYIISAEKYFMKMPLRFTFFKEMPDKRIQLLSNITHRQKLTSAFG